MEKNDISLMLIEAIKKHECIYNVHSPQYKQFEYKDHLWAIIGKEVGKTGTEAKMRWKTIRDNYKRCKHMAISENGIRKPYKYAESLRFLDDFPTDRSCIFTPAAIDAEVSTDLSSDDEFQYEPPAKQIKYDFENSFDEIEEFSKASTTDENSKSETFNVDTIASVSEQISTNNDNVDCILSSEEQVKEKNLNERVIEEVKKYDCIYNVKSPQYKNFTHKKRLWHKIGKRVGLTGERANKKWKNLKDTYRRYRLKMAIGEEGFIRQYKHADSLMFLDDFISLRPHTKKVNKLMPEPEISTDLSSDYDSLQIYPTNQEVSTSSTTDTGNSDTITSRLFQLLANKINEANLTPQEKNDIEYTVSSAVYSKLAEYNKNKMNRF